MLSAVGVGVLVLAGVAWMWNELSVIRDDRYRLYAQAGMAVGVILIGGGLLWWALNKPRVVDFMIATESEMRKVNWPTRREIIGSTWVVIGGTALMATLLFVVDISFAMLFRTIGVLEGGG
jgi:preprotein translocase subunit SecE